MANEQWRDIANKAKQKVYNDIPSEWRIPEDKLPADSELDVTGFPARSGVLSKLELEITDSSATDIVARIAKGEWKSEHVTRAFCKRAAIAHQVTNCLTVIMFNDAIERAKQLDTKFAEHGTVVGPLHGLPISLKDNFNIPGYPSSVGFCSWALEPMKSESTLVTILKNLGAVPYVKTNVPTAMMIAETVNNCYGRTTNPLNRATTSGGSSGGESSLIAFHGSSLGIGTDIGGSLRIPAACTGLFTLRPSSGRFPNFDARTGLSGQEAVGSVHGPMARNVADLRLYAQNMVNASPWLKDPKCIEIPWRDVQVKAKPKIAVMWDNKAVRPTPPVARALKDVVAKLKVKGYEIIDWPADDYVEAFEILTSFFLADGGTSVRKIIEPVGEPWRPEMKGYSTANDQSVYDLWQIQKRRTAFLKRVLDRWEASGDLDAILSPTTPYVAPKNGEFRYVGYTGIFNILDYSSVSFPTGLHADKARDTVPRDQDTYGEVDEQTQKEYDPNVVHGMPISLQLTAKRLQEEKILALTEKLVADLAS